MWSEAVTATQDVAHFGTLSNLAEVVAVVFTLVSAAAVALSIGNGKRKNETIETWKALYAAKEAEHEEHQRECVQRVATLEGRMGAMTEEFAHAIAMAVSGALKIVMEDHEERVPHAPPRGRRPAGGT